MLFSSPSFFAFFAIYFLLHLIIPSAGRILLIIAGSTFFYGWWKVEYVWLPFALTAVAYFGVLWIEAAADIVQRKRRMALTIAALFLPLVFFKYTDFIVRDVIGPLVWRNRHNVVDLPLPLGVSFITFTLTAYIVDICNKTYTGKAALPTTAGYVLFFPHLIAGPILRPAELMPQLERPRRALAARFYTGFAIFTLGLAKKLIFADQIAGFVDRVYKASAPSAPEALLAIYGFSMQIYCDFSGYTDMAIGIALIIGVQLPNNFLRPYGATSIVDFWRRWHITLSFWLRDYLYIPLGGNRGGRWRTYLNMIITMVLGGLWHGAHWTFVVWGFLHGAGVAFVHFFRTVAKARGWPSIPRWLGLLITFHFVTVLWVFFRAPGVRKAVTVLMTPLTGSWSGAAELARDQSGLLLLVAIFFALHGLDDHRRVKLALRRIRPEIVMPLIALVWAAAMVVSQGASAKFIYFDF